MAFTKRRNCATVTAMLIEPGARDVHSPERRLLVFFEPGENHWHGAARNRFMVHIAMQQNGEAGSPVTWGEHVSDEEYARDVSSV